MTELMATLGLASTLIILFWALGVIEEMEWHKQQAFDRGYMVQCIGKEGYYWECK